MKQIIGLFLMLLPLLASLGYDAYHHYLYPEDSFFSDLGWIWKYYHEDSHNYMYQYLGRDTWAVYVVPILQCKAVYIGGGITGLLLFTYLVMKVFGAASQSRSSSSFRRNSMSLGRDRSDQGAKKAFEYKRK